MITFCALIWILFFCVSFVLIKNKEKYLKVPPKSKKMWTYPHRILLAMVFFTANYLLCLSCFFEPRFSCYHPPTHSPPRGQRNTSSPHYKCSLRPARGRDPAASLCLREGSHVAPCCASFSCCPFPSRRTERTSVCSSASALKRHRSVLSITSPMG